MRLLGKEKVICKDCGKTLGFFGLFGKADFCDKCGASLCKRCAMAGDGGETLCRNCWNNRKGGRCFIATACYGENSNEVRILQNWRDKTLLENKYSEKIVNLYYKISPPIADYILDKPTIKRVVRKSLSIITILIKRTNKVKNNFIKKL